MAKFFHFKVEMFVLPRFERGRGRRLQGIERHQRSAAFVEVAADGGFRDVEVAVAFRVIAFAVKRRVFFRAELLAVQTMRGTEWRAESEKESVALPILGEKI